MNEQFCHIAKILVLSPLTYCQDFSTSPMSISILDWGLFELGLDLGIGNWTWAWYILWWNNSYKPIQAGFPFLKINVIGGNIAFLQPEFGMRLGYPEAGHIQDCWSHITAQITVSSYMTRTPFKVCSLLSSY